MGKKAWLYIIVLALGIGNGLNAQNDSTLRTPRGMRPVVVADEDEVVGSTDDLSFGHQVPLEGNEALNLLSGRRLANYTYSRLFLEFQGFISWDIAGRGATVCYIPQRWGVYAGYGPGTDMMNYNSYSSHFSLGVAVRPSMALRSIDWQLYGGLFHFDGHHMGLDVGMRFAPAGDVGPLSWLSVSPGFKYAEGTPYFTLGLSILLSGCCFISIF